MQKEGKKRLRMEQENKSLERNKITSEVVTQVAHAQEHHETKLAMNPPTSTVTPHSCSVF